MNIFVYELADGDPAPSPDISPRKLVVEDNVGESIHIHLRNLRLEFTIDEFERFADNVGIARQQVADGIVDDELATFELPAYGRCQIEADVNGNVHLHLGPFRVELSRAEFLEFAEVVLEGQARLHEVKADSEAADTPPEDEVVDAV